MFQDRNDTRDEPEQAPRRVRARMLAAVVAVMLFAAIGITPAEARPAEPATAEAQFLDLLNQERARNNLAPLQLHTGLRADARAWSQVMADQDRIFHTSSLADDTARSLPDWRRAGENVGYGPEVQRLHDAFVASPDHYRNIVGDFNHLGVGVVYKDTRIYVTFRFAKAPESSAVAASTNPVSTSVAAAQVRRLYLAFFEREPDSASQHWVDRVTTGFPLQRIADRFVATSEFVNTYGHLDNRAFIDLVYRNVMDRSPDASGYQYWLARMAGGLSRGDLMVHFSESSEFRRITA